MKKVFLILMALSGAVLLTSSQDEKLFQLNKTFEIYGSVIRELNELYVEDVDPEDLLVSGLNGIFEDLDPYTTFYREQEKDQINMITEGNYVGFGINIKRRNGEIIVSGFANDFIAHSSGLRIGDKLFKVDGTEVLTIDPDELKEYSQGTPGSKADVQVIRAKDTVSLKLTRHEVLVENVIYSGRTQKGMAYIKLERFSRGAAEDVKDAFLDLKKRNTSGLILDLRDNPGGLLDEAIKICELFIPKGSLIVSTKAKNTKKNHGFKSRRNPIDLDIPIAILIDEGSASASEIVAGCLQDHDRAVIIGRNSFGKGLVQTVRKLPYNTSMKLTTARYYTPSGRSIQRLDYYDKVHSDTAIFYTDGGRPLTERKGITPDTILPKKQYSDFISKIYNDDKIFDFSTIEMLEFEENDSVPPRYFKVDDRLIAEFSDYLESEKYIYKTDASKTIENLYIEAIELELDSEVDSLLDKLDEKFTLDNNKLIDNDTKDLAFLMRYDILSRFYNKSDLVAIFSTVDPVLETAENILTSEEYANILEVGEKY